MSINQLLSESSPPDPRVPEDDDDDDELSRMVAREAPPSPPPLPPANVRRHRLRQTLLNPHAAMAFVCDWCYVDQQKDPNGKAQTVNMLGIVHAGFAAECISPDNGLTWYCSDCAHYCTTIYGPSTISLSDFHSYRYKNSEGTVVTVQLKATAG